MLQSSLLSSLVNGVSQIYNDLKNAYEKWNGWIDTTAYQEDWSIWQQVGNDLLPDQT